MTRGAKESVAEATLWSYGPLGIDATVNLFWFIRKSSIPSPQLGATI